MATQAQIQANRANALKSTGPKTNDGKAVAAQNARTHGLTAQTDVLFAYENPEEYEQFAAQMTDSFSPQDQLEAFFVQRIIQAAWRLRRSRRLEINLMTPIKDLPSLKDFESLARFQFSSGIHTQIQRYETAIERSFFQCLATLRKYRESQLPETMHNYETKPIPNSSTQTNATIDENISPENEPNSNPIRTQFQPPISQFE